MQIHLHHNPNISPSFHRLTNTSRSLSLWSTLLWSPVPGVCGPPEHWGVSEDHPRSIKVDQTALVGAPELSAQSQLCGRGRGRGIARWDGWKRGG